MSFTPGPWDYIVRPTLIHIETALDNPSGAGFPICSIPKKAEGNARLIASAPELLEALESIENDDGRIPESIWAMRNAAIAKAKGEAPQDPLSETGGGR